MNDNPLRYWNGPREAVEMTIPAPNENGRTCPTCGRTIKAKVDRKEYMREYHREYRKRKREALK